MFSKMGQVQDASIDAENAVASDRTARSLYRRAKAYQQMGKRGAAVHGLWQGLEREPGNVKLEEEYNSCLSSIPVQRYFWQNPWKERPEYPKAQLADGPYEPPPPKKR